MSSAPISVSCEVLCNLMDIVMTSLPILVPYLYPCLHQLPDHGLELVFELCQLQNKVDKLLFIVCTLDSFPILFALAVVMEHEPSDGDIRVS